MIVYIYPVKTAFTERDILMLRSEHRVKPLPFTQSPILLPLFFILQFFQLLLLLPFTTHYMCFFGGYHSVIPVFLGKLFSIPTFIQAGGTDAVNMPSINYGNYRKKWLKKATTYSFLNCTKILPVAESLVAYDYSYDSSIPKKQGLKNLIPNLKTPIEVIYNGFDAELWKDLGKKRTPYSFITVAKGISKIQRAKVKGIDLIENLAKEFPDFHFTLIGDASYLPKRKNIKVVGSLNQTEIVAILNEHQYYLQLSTSEGFPNALAEAMLCGCVPIGSAVGDIPNIIADTGVILESRDIKNLKNIISSLDQSLFDLKSEMARKRIILNFSFEKRRNALLSLFQS
ncbi:glycosyltransferase [Belliella baltica DSM 15883]|uniref:Glycosyltransferase n=1 Tax=Belliella baltica (strain DSM 15883 / CIP 108006 / LMG 21964 / BA134) TaxID=866536 RepID=I3Z9B8_BELBD|nr:glycosyltransferase family 4 protein [Belliella baltica]AFL85836.1 glycosyltransferase [Belliella baltica DSM 15883]